MADVYTVTFIIIGMLISLPGLLVAINLLLPRMTGRVQTQLAQTPGRSFVVGVPVTAVFALFIAVAVNGPGVVQAAAFIAAGIGMGLGTLGAAGMARLLGQRLGRLSAPRSEMATLVRGAVVYELACLFPLVGWFLFAPLVGITVVGAAVMALPGALFGRRTPAHPEPQPVNQQS